MVIRGLSQLRWMDAMPTQVMLDVSSTDSDGGSAITKFEICQMSQFVADFRQRLSAPSQFAPQFNTPNEESEEMAAFYLIEEITAAAGEVDCLGENMEYGTELMFSANTALAFGMFVDAERVFNLAFRVISSGKAAGAAFDVAFRRVTIAGGAGLISLSSVIAAIAWATPEEENCRLRDGTPACWEHLTPTQVLEEVRGLGSEGGHEITVHEKCVLNTLAEKFLKRYYGLPPTVEEPALREIKTIAGAYGAYRCTTWPL